MTMTIKNDDTAATSILLLFLLKTKLQGHRIHAVLTIVLQTCYSS